jgi:ubiquinone/menaquinone biosynthesis C-methylase UbiE
MAKEFAKLTGDTGKVYALDQDDVSIDTLKSETENTVIEPFVGDITKETPLSPCSIDLIYVSMVLHGFAQTQMEGFLREVNRLLKPGERLAIVEIDKVETPFGPPLEIRISPEELKQTITLHPLHLVDIGQFYYMQVFQK